MRSAISRRSCSLSMVQVLPRAMRLSSRAAGRGEHGPRRPGVDRAVGCDSLGGGSWLGGEGGDMWTCHRNFRPGRVLMALIGAAIVYALWQRHQDTLDKENPVNLPIVADAYVWPTGCDEKIYERGDNISWKSQSSKYYMRSRLKYRFSSDINPKNTSYYYMVGNDAIK